MNNEFLENMGIAFIRLDHSDNIISSQKDEHFNLDLSDLNELLTAGNWLKDYKRAKKSRQNQVGKIMRLDKIWVSFEVYPKTEYIDIKFENVSKMQSERLVIIREIVKGSWKISEKIAPFVFGVLGLMWVTKSFLEHRNEAERHKDIMIARQLKEERSKWFGRMQKQDSVLVAQTSLLQSINTNLQKSGNQNKIIADLTRFYRVSEEQNLALLTDLTVIDYLMSEPSEQLTEIKKFYLTNRYP
jgi:hypothetical protein